MRAIDKEFPKPTDNLIQIMFDARAGKYSKQEAFKVLMKTPELLDQLPFVLFVSDAGLQGVISHEEYVSLMKNKAIKTKNQGLMNLIKDL